ncbi:uncharacterized protein LOC127260322 [Andrographis paniculata]|uniref:uncharacterized protein LOC127260322 n=1 Tax=Andrographis paniculata TaxID=175694 RepID=UPI0021E83AFA|nr:uncharacterized protein LOC127260322 [Andrographis paniculata]
MKPPGVTDEQIKLRAFPFSLKDAAKDWLYYVPPGSIDTWNDMKKKFLEKYFPASRAAILRKEICGIKQQSGETLHEYWERFNKLIIKCPQHQIPPQLLIQYFYDGLSLMDRNIIDAASGGVLVNKTPAQAWDLIARMAENMQQFGSRDVGQMSGNNSDHAIQSMQQQLSELTSFVRKMVVEKSNPSVQVKVCGICTSAGHPTDACPTLQEECAVDVNTANYGMNRPPAYTPYSNTYNPGWRDHPNLRYGNAQHGNAHQPFGAMQQMQQPPQAPISNSGPSLEDLVKSMATSTLQFQQEMKSNVDKLQGPPPISKEQNEDQIEMENEKEVELHEKVFPNSIPPTETKSAHFPDRLKKPQKANKRKKMMEIFKKVELNIPLLEAINQIPKYAKFLKELCTNKRKLRGDEHIIAGENISAVIKRKVPPKTGDPGMFSIPCKIGKTEITKAMLDLGAAINVMPRSIYDSLNLGPLKETGIIIQLGDRTHSYPDGMIEDVLVQLEKRATGESKKRKKIVEMWRWIPKGSPLLAAKKYHKENQNSKPKKKCVANRHRFKLYHEGPSLDPIKLAPVANFDVQN